MTITDHQHCEKKWPGLDPERGSVSYPDDPRKRFAELAGFLGERLQELTGQAAGSEFDLLSKADPSLLESQFESIERWGGGQDFSRTVRAGHRELSTIYHQVNEKLRAAIALIESAGTAYQYASGTTFNNGKSV